MTCRQSYSPRTLSSSERISIQIRPRSLEGGCSGGPILAGIDFRGEFSEMLFPQTPYLQAYNPHVSLIPTFHSTDLEASRRACSNPVMISLYPHRAVTIGTHTYNSCLYCSANDAGGICMFVVLTFLRRYWLGPVGRRYIVCLLVLGRGILCWRGENGV